jgi:hypothetical protein
MLALLIVVSSPHHFSSRADEYICLGIIGKGLFREDTLLPSCAPACLFYGRDLTPLISIFRVYNDFFAVKKRIIPGYRWLVNGVRNDNVLCIMQGIAGRIRNPYHHDICSSAYCLML